MWPKQSECNQFYGDPRKDGFINNLVGVRFPWQCFTSWDGKVYKFVQVHQSCAESLRRILAEIWTAAEQSQEKIHEWGMDICGGGYNFRVIRGGTSLSMHSYGCAVDFDPARNALGDPTPHFEGCNAVLVPLVSGRLVVLGAFKSQISMRKAFPVSLSHPLNS